MVHPARGYQVGTVTATPSTLSLCRSKRGSCRASDRGNMIIVSAESEAVNVSGATSDLDVEVDEQFLPGISLADGVSSTVCGQRADSALQQIIFGRKQRILP